MNTSLKLGAEFPPSSDEEWRNLVEQTLKGRDFDKALVHKTDDDIAIQPLYAKENAVDAHALNIVHTRGWDIRQSYKCSRAGDAKAVNQQILNDLKGGTTSILLQGSKDDLFADLTTVLKGVHLDMIRVGLDVTGSGLDQSLSLQALQGYFNHHKGASIDFGLDPLGSVAHFGGDEEDLLLALSSMIITATENTIADNKCTAININTKPYHGGGASEAQELAFALATGVQYLRHMEDAQISLDVAAGQIIFTLAADADFNLTLSKFRAFRLLWARVLDASGLMDVSTKVYGETAARMFSKRDPWVNILRGTVACFAAGIAGADGVTVNGYNSALGEGGEQSRRIARNIQIILQEESGLAQVVDPASGSWAIESITASLVEKAWEIFQTIEANGGMGASLIQGTVQEMIAENWFKKAASLAKRKIPLTGVSEFPNIHEAPVKVNPVEPIIQNFDAVIKPVRQHRLAEDFEGLRDKAEEYDVRPRVFLANLGGVSKHVARATWAKNFVEVGGFEAIATDGFDDAGTLAEAFKTSGAGLAIICGTDDQYSGMASDVAATLKTNGAKVVYLAGRATSITEGDDNINGHIHVGVNVLDVLARMFNELGEVS